MSSGANTNLNVPTGSVPYDYQSLLQQAADEHRIIAGAGGALRVLTLEDTIIPPSEEGVTGSQWGNPVLTSDPLLGAPDLSNVAIWSQQLGADFLQLLTGLSIPVDSSQEGGTSIPEEEAYIKLATIMHATGAEEPPSGDTVTVLGTGFTNVSSAFQTWLASFAEDFDPTTLIPTDQDIQSRQNLQSTDSSIVKTELLSMANLDALNLDPTQRAFIEDKLGQLADTLALVNQAGGNGFLNMTIPELILPLLMGALDMPSDLSLSPDQRESLTAALLNISQGMAQLNFKSLIQTETPSLEFNTLTSGDPAKIASLLKVICQTTTLIVDLPPETLSQIVDNLGVELAKIDPEALSTMDDATLQQTLSNAFDAAVSSVSIPDDMKAALKEALLPAISCEMTNVFTAKLTADLHSGDPATIFKSLTLLTGVDTDPSLSPAGKAIVRDYLKAMTMALAFLAQIRATIASLEGSLTQNLAKSKLNQIANQVQNAVELLKNEFTKADAVLKKTIKDINHAHLMKWLMPFIALFVAIVMLVVIVVSIVFTVVTGGAGAPAIAGAMGLAAQLIGLAVAASVASLSVVIAVADLAMSASTNKGLWDRLADAAGIKDPALKALLVTFIQLIADIITIVATFGIGAAAVGVQSGLKVAATVAKEAVRGLVNMSTLVGMTVVGCVISAIMSGGLITLGLAKLGKLIFGNDKDGNIFAIIMTIMLMIALCIATQKLSSGAGATGAAQIGVTAASVGQAAGQTTEISVGAMARTIASNLAKLLQGIGGAVDQAVDVAQMGLRECLGYIMSLLKEIGKTLASNFVGSLKQTAENLRDRVKELVTELYHVFKPAQIIGPQMNFTMRLERYLKSFINANLAANVIEGLKLTTSGLQMYAAYLQYKYAKFTEEFSKEMANLESISAALQAIITMLENMKGNDATKVIEDITQGAQDQSERWGSLVQLVESMINSASAEANKLVTV